ncbi:hypothetical protein NLX69_12640 [Rossellomorea sp. BNER]|nr:hypothetical protein [Rossellomorea sp. BNER]
MSKLLEITCYTLVVVGFTKMEVIGFSLIMFYLPVFLLLIIIQILIERKTGQKVVI